MGRVIDCSGISDTGPEKPVRFVRGGLIAGLWEEGAWRDAEHAIKHAGEKA